MSRCRSVPYRWGKDVFYALDEDERQGVMDRIKVEKRTAGVSVNGLKG